MATNGQGDTGVSITFQGSTNHFCLREGISPELLETLIKSVFAVDSSVLALQSQRNGVIFDLWEFCSSNACSHSQGDCFQLILANGNGQSNGNGMRQSQRSQSTLSSNFSRNNNNNNNNHPHKPSMKSLPRPKSFDAQSRNTKTFSAKSGSKNDDKYSYYNTFYVEDYEGFMTQNKETTEQLFCFLLFDETKIMKLYGYNICKAYSLQFPTIDFYYSLYPSKRSRGAFQPSDDAYLLSFFHGHSMIFEREVAVSSEVSEEIVKALSQFLQRQEMSLAEIKQPKMLFNFNEDGNYTENSFSMVNVIGSEIGFNNRVRDSSFEDFTAQDRVYEIVDCFSQSRIRCSFSDDEFKELLKLVRKNNKRLNSIYEQFKISGDFDEILTNIRNLMNLPTDIAPQKNSQKKQQQPEMSFHATTAAAGAAGASIKQGLKNKKKKKLLSLKGLKQFLRDNNNKLNSPENQQLRDNSMLSCLEIGYLVYCIKSDSSDTQTLELLDDLSNYSNLKLAQSILKSYVSVVARNLLAKHFNPQQIKQIEAQWNIKNTPIHAALLNWMVLGDLEGLVSVIQANLDYQQQFKTQKRSQKNNKQQDENFSPHSLNNNSNEDDEFIKTDPLNDDIQIEDDQDDLGDNNVENIIDNSNNFNFNNSNIRNNNNTHNNNNYSSNYPNQDTNMILNNNNQFLEYSPCKDEPVELYGSAFSHHGLLLPSNDFFRYSLYACNKKKNRRPTFTLHARKSTDSPQEKSVVMSIDQNYNEQGIKDLLDGYFKEAHFPKDEIYYEIYFKVRQLDHFNEEQLKNLEEIYELNYPPFYKLLDDFSVGQNVNQELIDVQTQFGELKEMIKVAIDFSSPLCEDKLNKYKGFLVNIAYLFYQDFSLTEKAFKSLGLMYLRQELSVLAAYELYCLDLDLEDFRENIQLVEQLHFFKQTVDQVELDSLDEHAHLANIIFFLLKSTNLSQETLGTILKVILLGDREVLKIYNMFAHQKDPNATTSLLRELTLFAEQRAQDVERIEKRFQPKDKSKEEIEKKINYELDTLYTFSPLLKGVDHMSLIEDLVREQHKLIVSVFEVYGYTKDKQDIVESITLIYKWNYTQALKNLIKKELFDQTLAREKIQLMMELVDVENSLVLSAWETYLEMSDLDEFKDTLKMIVQKNFHQGQ